jgi:hypothetical protein
LDGKQEKTLNYNAIPANGSRGSDLAWSPDGRWLLLAESGSFSLFDVDVTDKSHFATSDDYAGPRSVDWSHDSKRYVVGGETVKVFDVGGHVGYGLPDCPVSTYGYRVAWSPDGHRISGLGYERLLVWTYSEPAGHFSAPISVRLPRHTISHISHGSHQSWHPDSRKLVTALAPERCIVSWDSFRLEPEWLSLLLVDGESITFSPEGEILDGDPEVVEEELIYLLERPDGEVELLKPSTFREGLECAKTTRTGSGGSATRTEQTHVASESAAANGSDVDETSETGKGQGGGRNAE